MGTQAIPINQNLVLQTPYLFCQAAGSTGGDQSMPGIHLRWDLAGELANVHIPKGELFYNTHGREIGFNKQHDFISIYRTQATSERVVLEANAVEGYESLPNYAGLVFPLYTGHRLVVRFTDRAQFLGLLQQGYSRLNEFLENYDGLIELEIEGQLMYNYEVGFTLLGSPSASSFGVETIVATNRYDRSNDVVIKRENVNVNGYLNISTEGENIRYVRLMNLKECVIVYLSFMTYEMAFDYYQNSQTWEHLGEYALTVEDYEAFSRFEGEPFSGFNLQWPKYNDGVLVNPPNYEDRWISGNGGIRETVQAFIQESLNNPRGEIRIPSDDNPEVEGMTISLLDTMRLVAMDYHIARMLGLGLLDRSASNDPSTKYVYAAVYATQPELKWVNKDIDHVFMTLPTNNYDERLPVAPSLELDYGLWVDTDNSGEPELLSDANGYSFYDDARFINLKRTNALAPRVIQNIIPENDEFDGSQISQPIGYGIEYRTGNDSWWLMPELLNDEEYTDVNGNAESNITPEKEGSVIYTHTVREPGHHIYGLYAVNWFSRASELSGETWSDYTDFVKRNRLLPPSNIGVQYIQEEDPVIFTTQSEQDALAAANASNPSADNNKTRVFFEWNEIHNMAYDSANRVSFHFRTDPIVKVEGMIATVVSVTAKRCLITTSGYSLYSHNPAVPVVPDIPGGTEDRFIGSFLCTAEGQFRIISVESQGVNPTLLIEKITSLQAAQAEPEEPYTTTPIFISPKANDVFFIYENVNNENYWLTLNKTVELIKHSNHRELIYEDDGSAHEEYIGGVYGQAQVEPILDNGQATGGYTITFNGYNLAPHPDPAVSWMKGSARVVLNGTQKKKSLPVASIISLQPLQFVVFDAEYLNTSTPVATTTGTNTLEVNFYPGYKVYLSPEAGFGKQQILPVGTANTRKTFMALRSIDTTMPYHSHFSHPLTIISRNIQPPIKPEAVLGPGFATRPDFYGKSTYTVDVTLNANGRAPYGLMVYKATERSVLQALYKAETVAVIIAELEAMAATDQYKFNRWLDLMKVETSNDSVFHFKPLGGYQFPDPDNEETELFIQFSNTNDFYSYVSNNPYKPFPLDSSKSKATHKKLVESVIESVFVSLTETPILCEFLKTGKQTSSEKPRIHDVVGRLLNPTDPAFNPFPMAVKLPPTGNQMKVRVTDYTIHGSARNLYFYFSKEVALTGKLSDRSDIAGPIILVDASPPDAPKIRRVVSREANPYLGISAAIEFEVADYLDSESITSFGIYRSYDTVTAAATKSMQLVKTVPKESPIVDDFSDRGVPPFGQPLFYRLVAYRKIKDERNQDEYVPSEPSEVILCNIMDVVNPNAPAPWASKTTDPVTGDLQNVKLHWHRTAFNGTYYVYKMNNKGNWEKVYVVKSNKEILEFPEGGNYNDFPFMALLDKTDEEGNTIYHRFKIDVENASGLFNLEEKEIVL